MTPYCFYFTECTELMQFMRYLVFCYFLAAHYMAMCFIDSLLFRPIGKAVIVLSLAFLWCSSLYFTSSHR